MDIQSAVEELDKLNTLLQAKCPNLSLSLQLGKKEKGHYYTDFEGINETPILCLVKEDECISSIILSQDKTNYWTTSGDIVFQMLTFTKKEEEGKKYSKLLCAIAIYIGKFITIDELPIKYYLAYAESPISAHLLASYYSITFPEESDFYKYKNKEKNNEKPLTELFKEFIDIESSKAEEERMAIVILLELNNNISISETIFNEIISILHGGFIGIGKKKRTRKNKNKNKSKKNKNKSKSKKNKRKAKRKEKK
jgi:hypothetical protein